MEQDNNIHILPFPNLFYQYQVFHVMHLLMCFDFVKEEERRKKKEERRRKKKEEERRRKNKGVIKKIGVRYNKQTNFKRQEQASSNKQAGTTPHTYPAALVPGFLSDKNSADNLITFVASFEVSSRGAPCVSTA